MPAVEAARKARLDLADRSEAGALLSAALREVIERHRAIDPKTREVVHQSTDQETGEVARLVSEDAIKRIRAYGREGRERQGNRAADDPPRVEKIA